MLRRSAHRLLALALAVVLLGVATPTPGRVAGATLPLYTVTDLGILPRAASGRATALNDAGQVVGVSGDRAFLWDAPAGLRDLGTLPGDTSAAATALNNTGQVAGTSAGTSGRRAVLWDAAGVPRDLGIPPGMSSSAAHSLNDPGQVVGEATCFVSGSHSGGIPVLWDAGGAMRDPTGAPLPSSCPGNYGGVSAARGIDGAGQIVGVLTDGFTDWAVLWDATGVRHDLGTFSSGASGQANAINGAGEVIGTVSARGISGAVLWDAAGVRHDLGTLPGTDSSEALAINTAGVVVGTAQRLASPDTAVLWDAAGGPHNLNDSLPAGAGWVLLSATGINDRGQIVGRGLHNGQERPYLLTPRFADLTPGTPYLAAILALADRDVIRGYGDGRVGPGDPVLRAQSAALIARAAGWDAEDWPDATFPDQGTVDADLWRNVRTLAHYRVALGYADGTYDPTGAVLEQQVVLFVTRALVARGTWAEQADTGAFPNLPNGTDREQADRRTIATYVHYAGAAPDRPVGQPWTGWDQPAPRGWVAQALWQALQTHPAP